MAVKKISKKQKEAMLLESANMNAEMMLLSEQFNVVKNKRDEIQEEIEACVDSGFYMVNGYELEVNGDGKAAYCGRDYSKL